MIIVRGMYGVGDCLHQRAIVRELMKQGDEVTLETFYWSMYEDLLKEYEGQFHLALIGGVPPRIKDAKQAYLPRTIKRTKGLTRTHRVTYTKDTIHKYGSILAAQFACVHLKMPEKPDFSLPVPDAWKDGMPKLMREQANAVGKPLMVYRPSVLNDVWLSPARAPKPMDYATLYEAVRGQFYTVSVANLGNRGERIDGPEMPADVKFHHGQLQFEELAGMFAEADVAFTCPGFAPVLSQAVGTPTIITYGGNESFATTNSVGAHLAATLALEPINPCACHLKEHDCNKTMDVVLQLLKLSQFVLQIKRRLQPAVPEPDPHVRYA